MYLLAMSIILLGIVAEKRPICLGSGTESRMNSMSSMKPMSSMVSASSRTTYLTLLRSRLPRLRWSIILPGVPTTTCTPRSSASNWTLIDWPP